MILSKKLKILIAALGLVFLAFAGTFFCTEKTVTKASSVAGREDEETILIDLFVFAPCESCHEEEKFSKEVTFKLAEAGIKDTECRVYNVYKESGSARFEEVAETYGLSISMKDLPAAVVQGEVYLGTYEQIAEALAKHSPNPEKNDQTQPASDLKPKNKDEERKRITDNVVYREICSAGKDDVLVILFVTGSCESCIRAEEYLKKLVPDGQFCLRIHNIMEDDNVAVLRKLMKIYGVPESLQQVPLLFYKNGYYSGADAIRRNVPDSLKNKETAGPWEDAASELLKEKEDISISRIKLLATGFINGLNPCGISMLLMVLSVILMSGKSFFKGSLAYLAGKFLTYLLLGFTIGTFFSVVESRIFGTVQEILNIFLAVLALFFGLFYLMDFIYVLRKDYGRERLRLPERFRKWNHGMIKKLSEVQGNYWYPMLFLLGIAISAGEFLCTGQVYLATLLYMAEQNGAFSMDMTGNLLIYLAAMSVPMVLLVILVSKGKNVMSASHISLKILPFIKLCYSIFFFVLFFSLLF